MNMRLLRSTTAGLIILVTALAGMTGCGNNKRHVEERCCEEHGRHVRVRAPFTRVDVFIPDDDPDETRVDVNVRR